MQKHLFFFGFTTTTVCLHFPYKTLEMHVIPY